MKIRECIKDACDLTKDGVLKLTLPCLFVSVATVLIATADARLRANGKLDGDVTDDKEFMAYWEVLNGLSWESLAQHMQFHQFCEWWLEQEAPEDDEWLWYDLPLVTEAWNTFIKEQENGESES